MCLTDNFVSSKDTATHRVCGTCGQSKPVSEFYKDGTDKDGKMKYSRDSKECYKVTRIQDASLKKKKKGGKRDEDRYK